MDADTATVLSDFSITQGVGQEGDVVVDPDDDYFIVASSDSNTIVVLDDATGKIVDEVSVAGFQFSAGVSGMSIDSNRELLVSTMANTLCRSPSPRHQEIRAPVSSTSLSRRIWALSTGLSMVPSHVARRRRVRMEHARRVAIDEQARCWMKMTC